MLSTSPWGRGMTCTDTTLPIRFAAVAPASVAALTGADFAGDDYGNELGADILLGDEADIRAFTIASAASIAATRPFVSTNPIASMFITSKIIHVCKVI